NLTAVAKQLKAAGVPGKMDTLRAEAFLALLTGTPVDSLLPADPSATHEPAAACGSAGTGAPAAPADRVNPGTAGFPGGPGLPASPADPAAPTTTHHPAGSGGTMHSPVGPGLTGTVNPAPGPCRTVHPSVGLSGSVNLTMPLATWLGLSEAPAPASGSGPLDASDSRALARILAARAGSQWCLTFTDARGSPLAHGCARAGPAPDHRHGDLGPAPRSRGGPRSRSRPGSTWDRWTFTITLFPGAACDHAWQTGAYQPSPALRHLVGTRHDTCVFPGCRRPAAQCDQDHTVPYDQGGKTCLCNLAPLCRRHHRTNQARGWGLTQVTPGALAWPPPAGRHCLACPAAADMAPQPQRARRLLAGAANQVLRSP